MKEKMTDKYERGDVLENLALEGTYTLVIDTPSSRSDGCYHILNLILQQVNSTERKTEEDFFRMPAKALREPREDVITSEQAYRKVDHVDLSPSITDGLTLRERAGRNPELEKYLRIRRNY